LPIGEKKDRGLRFEFANDAVREDPQEGAMSILLGIRGKTGKPFTKERKEG